MNRLMERSVLNNIFFISLVALTVFVSTTQCSADEEKGHICFNTVDINKDSKVTFEKFAVYFGNDEVKFNKIDRDGDGKLSHDEYHEFLGHGA